MEQEIDPQARDSPKITSESDHDQYPEGGLKAWSVVLGAWCAMIPSMGLLNSLGTLQPWTSTHQLKDYSESSIGWIYGAYTFFLVLGGVSASTLFAPPLAAVGHWFNVRRGWATGVACTAGGVGGCIFPLIILFAAPRIGFAWAIRIIALKAGPSLDFRALRDIKYASATLSVFLVEFAVFIPITYITSYTLHAGFDEQMSYAVLVFLNLGAVFGRFLPGLVADRLGRFNVMIMSSFICSLFTLTLWLSADLVEPHSLGMVISYAVLFGFWSGTAISLAPVCISQVCEIQDYGKRVGTTWTIVSVGTLIAIPIAGAIQQHNNGEYYGLIIFGGVLYISSTIAFIVSRGICKGWALKIKF
ncbi:putative transporter [Penicillium chrysogenum]|uniref:Putative transporter n=1 Tax=Penicillium chrysogenum TaxID=5076 RepID=A0A167YLY0_PENCH|nr:putative transporter [Penicillium chrysogenum]